MASRPLYAEIMITSSEGHTRRRRWTIPLGVVVDNATLGAKVAPWIIAAVAELDAEVGGDNEDIS
jgi:hypothetical protein